MKVEQQIGRIDRIGQRDSALDLGTLNGLRRDTESEEAGMTHIYGGNANLGGGVDRHFEDELVLEHLAGADLILLGSELRRYRNPEIDAAIAVAKVIAERGVIPLECEPSAGKRLVVELSIWFKVSDFHHHLE